MSGIELPPSLLGIFLTSEFGFPLAIAYCVAYFWGCLHWMSFEVTLWGVWRCVVVSSLVAVLESFVFDYLLDFLSLL